MKSVTIGTMLLLAFLSTCDSGCVRLFAPKAEVSDTRIAEQLSPTNEGQESVDHANFGALLQDHVDYEAGRVDYARLAEDKAALDEYLSTLASVDLARLDGNAQLALLINAYNAFTLALILEHYPDIESIKDIDSPWETRRWKLGGDTVSLNEIEHGLIRPIYRDSRIHFAVNCASIGCPPLAPWPYRGAELDEQLDRAAQRTLQDQSYARIADGELQVTSLLNWYKSDFISDDFAPSAASIPAYVARFGDADVRTFVSAHDKPDYSFIEYDWSLNDVE